VQQALLRDDQGAASKGRGNGSGRASQSIVYLPPEGWAAKVRRAGWTSRGKNPPSSSHSRAVQQPVHRPCCCSPLAVRVDGAALNVDGRLKHVRPGGLDQLATGLVVNSPVLLGHEGGQAQQLHTRVRKGGCEALEVEEKQAERGERAPMLGREQSSWSSRWQRCPLHCRQLIHAL